MSTKHILEYHRKHAHESVCLLGNGPTLKGLPFHELAKRHTLLGINKSWTETIAHYHCFQATPHWEDFCKGVLDKCQAVFTMSYFQRHPTAPSAPDSFRGHLVYAPRVPQRQHERTHFDYDLAQGCSTRFAGYFAIQLAVWMGFKTIYLLGYDAHDDEGHHHDDVRATRHQYVKTFGVIAKWFAQQSPDGDRLNIYNCNPHSAIKCFPYCDKL